MHTDESLAIDLSTLFIHISGSSWIYINELPDIILLSVFSNFTPQQLCTLLAKVCSRWHKLSREPSLWRQLKLGFASLKKAVTLFHTSPLEELRSFSWWERNSGDTVLALLAGHCPRLTVLKVLELSVSQKALHTLAASCPNIQELEVHRLAVSGSGDKSFAPFRNLRVLHITSGVKPDEYLPVSLRSCSNLESLHLHVHGHDACRVHSLIENASNVLVSLHWFSDGSIQEGTFAAIARCSKLFEIDISAASQLGNIDFGTFGELRDLERLRISGNRRLTAPGLRRAFSTAGNFENLKELSFTRVCNVTNNVLIALANNVSQLASLRLTFCSKVTDLGVSLIIAKCHKLETLHVTGSQLSGACVRRVIPGCLPKLRELTLRCRSIDYGAITKLRLCRPGVRLDIQEY